MIDKLIETGGCYGMEMNVKKTEVMRISRQQFSIKIMIDQKRLENVESFKYLGSILTNDGRCTCEIKCSIATSKAAFNKKRALLLGHWTWNWGKKAIEVIHLEHSFIWCWNLDASGSRSETPGKFWNMVLEKDGENNLARSCEKLRSIT